MLLSLLNANQVGNERAPANRRGHGVWVRWHEWNQGVSFSALRKSSRRLRISADLGPLPMIFTARSCALTAPDLSPLWKSNQTHSFSEPF